MEAGRRPQQQGRAGRNRADLTPVGGSLGRQTVTRLPPSWAGQNNGHIKKTQTPRDRASEKKRDFLMSSAAAELNVAA